MAAMTATLLADCKAALTANLQEHVWVFHVAELTAVLRDDKLVVERVDNLETDLVDMME